MIDGMASPGRGLAQQREEVRDGVMLPAHAANDPHWREWMRQLGVRVRQMRELVGLSQDQLASSVGVSQGAVSRLEHGRGLNTPLLVALKVYGGLVAALEGVAPAALSDDARALVVQLQALGLPEDGRGASGDAPVLAAPEVEEVIRLCHRLPAPRRRVLMDAMRALAAALLDE